MLTAYLLAHLLNHPATATATWAATVAIETQHAAQVACHERAEQLGAWLDRLDGERIAAAAVYSPFADDDEPVSPFAVAP